MAKRKVTSVGRLDKRIEIQRLKMRSDGQGGKVESWESFIIDAESGNKVWARVEPINASERYFSQKLEYQRSHKIIIRYLKGLNTTMRIVYHDVCDGPRVFQIKAFRNVDERHFFIEIDAQENVGA